MISHWITCLTLWDEIYFYNKLICILLLIFFILIIRHWKVRDIHFQFHSNTTDLNSFLIPHKFQILTLNPLDFKILIPLTFRFLVTEVEFPVESKVLELTFRWLLIALIFSAEMFFFISSKSEKFFFTYLISNFSRAHSWDLSIVLSVFEI